MVGLQGPVGSHPEAGPWLALPSDLQYPVCPYTGTLLSEGHRLPPTSKDKGQTSLWVRPDSLLHRMLCFLLVIGVSGAASRKVRSERGVRDTLAAAVCVWVLACEHSDFGPVFWRTNNTPTIPGGTCAKAPALPLPAAHGRQGCWHSQGPERLCLRTPTPWGLADS